MCTLTCNALNAGTAEQFPHRGENHLSKPGTLGGIGGWYALPAPCSRYYCWWSEPVDDGENTLTNLLKKLPRP